MAERAQEAPAAHPRIWHHSHSHSKDILTAILFRQPGIKLQSQGTSPSQQPWKGYIQGFVVLDNLQTALFSFNLLPEESILACSLTFAYFLFDCL